MTFVAGAACSRRRSAASGAPPHARLPERQDRQSRAPARVVHEPGDARLRRMTGLPLQPLYLVSFAERDVWPDQAEQRGPNLRRRLRALAGGGRMSDHDHPHDHPHEPITNGGEPAAAARVRALEELLVEKGVITREDVRARDRLARLAHPRRRRASRRTRLGRPRVQGNGCSRMPAPRPSRSGSTRGRHPSSSRSRTPRTSTTWSSARSARATRRRCSGRRPTGTRACRTGRERCPTRAGCLREFGLELGDDVEVRVVDSTADIRYLVIPARPPGRRAFRRTSSPRSSRATR